jgi:hypothetical protein
MDEITTCTAAVDSAVKVWNAPSEPVNPAMPKGRFVPHYCLSSVLCWRQEMALHCHEPSGRNGAVTDRPERDSAVAAGFGRILRATR